MDVHELTDIIHVIKMPLFQIVCLSCVEHPQVCSINSEICGSALSEVKHTSSQERLLLFLIQTADQQHSEKQKQELTDENVSGSENVRGTGCGFKFATSNKTDLANNS